MEWYCHPKIITSVYINDFMFITCLDKSSEAVFHLNIHIIKKIPSLCSHIFHSLEECSNFTQIIIPLLKLTRIYNFRHYYYHDYYYYEWDALWIWVIKSEGVYYPLKHLRCEIKRYVSSQKIIGTFWQCMLRNYGFSLILYSTSTF